MDPEVLSIGIWGMGGVGKTTLVTHIHNRVQEHSDTFDGVYWVTVAQNPSMSKLQGDIAKEIHFDISSEDNLMKRAAILSRELRRRKRSVLILDDVWNAICLEKIGISLAVNGCKVVITTRSLEVCRSLGCQKKIKVEPLSDKEARQLFTENLGPQGMPSSRQVLEVAKCVARECCGLPLGIITMARCMREVDDVSEWRDALQSLRDSKEGLVEMDEEVFPVLKFSYNRLIDPKVQQCFLYCALYREDCKIVREELIQQFIDEGLIETLSRQAKFDKGHAILNKLVNSCLLEGVECNGDNESVKMHDLVRDMALKMMSPQFMVKAGMQLDEIPDGQEWSEDVERVSLMRNNIEVIASDTTRPRCPKLVTLLLSFNGSLKRMENSFIENMPALQVLDLSFCTKIEELPNSISNLKNLSALLLHGCSMLQGMPSVSELKSLKRLDFRSSGIREVPHGLEMLVNLTYLDLRTCMKVFPTGILPKLIRLEHLTFQLYSGVRIKGEELIRLKRLSTFEGHLIYDDVNGFKAYVMSRKLYQGPNCSFHFVLDDGSKSVEEKYEDNLKHVRISKWSICKSAAQENAYVNNDVVTLEVLLKDVQTLEIEDCSDAQSLCDVSWLDDATQDLKQCKIENCDGIQCVVSFSSSASWTSPYFLQTLEKLDLWYLYNLEVLFELKRGPSPQVLTPPVAGTVFSCLKLLFLLYCTKIKTLFQPWFLPNLKNLEEIVIKGCYELEEIIASDEDSNHSYTGEYVLPNLRILDLKDLPELKSICAETIICDCLSHIIVEKCPNLNRIPLSEVPSHLTVICVNGKDGDEWWESVQLDNANAKNLLQPYLEFSDNEESEVEEEEVSDNEGNKSFLGLC